MLLLSLYLQGHVFSHLIQEGLQTKLQILKPLLNVVVDVLATTLRLKAADQDIVVLLAAM